MKKALALALILWMSSVSPALAAFSYSRTVTIDKTKVPSDQTNFPVLVNGVYSYLATVANGGKVTSGQGFDVGFYTNSDCSTGKMAWEQVSWSPTTGTVEYWIKNATVSSSANTVFYMCYGDSSITTDQSATTTVWDASTKVVYHLGNGSTLGLDDSTSAGATLTNTNAVTASAGKIGGGTAAFNGTNQLLSHATLPSIPSGSSIRISYWIKQSSLTYAQSASAFSVGRSDNPNRIQAHSPWSDGVLYWDYGDASDQSRVTTNITSYFDAWAKIDLTYNTSDFSRRIYVNGNQVNGSIFNQSPTSAQSGIQIGGWVNLSTFYSTAQFDEFRVDTSARSADWITTEYNNESATSTFYTIGSETPFTVATTARPRLLLNSLLKIVKGFLIIR